MPRSAHRPRATSRRILYAIVSALTVAAVTLGVSSSAHAATPVRIMPLGDSITGGPGCWRAVLWDRLVHTGFTNIDFVGTLPGGGCSVAHDGDNEGHGGFLATGIANQNQLPAWLAATHPDIVLMHLGTNDVWNNIAASTILAAYSTLVDQMRVSNPSMKIVVAQILPMTPSGCTWCPPGVTALNSAIPGWAAGKSTAQSPITVVDQFTGFDTAANTTDGVHPNDAGFQKMSDRWYPALTPLLGATPPPVDTTAPTVPSGLAVTVTCNPLTVRLSWTAATDNVGVTGYDVFRAPNGSSTFTQIATTATTSFTEPLTNVFQYEVRARDAAGNVSALSAPVTSFLPPCPAPDTVPPTTPGTPTASGTTASATTLSWAASTDNFGVTGYDIFRATGTGGTFALVGTSTTPTFTDTGLAPSTVYRYEIRARDAAGNVSPFSGIVTVTTLGSGGAGCSAVYRLTNSWGGGFQAEVTVTNNATTATTAWSVGLTFANGQRITQLWNARTSSTASPYTITNETYNGALAPAGSTAFGFLGSGSSTGAPTVTCTRTP